LREAIAALAAKDAELEKVKAERNELSVYFRDEAPSEGFEGDVEGLSPIETALKVLRRRALAERAGWVNLRAELLPVIEEWRAWATEWAGTAWIADEALPPDAMTDSEHRVELYRDLCKMMNVMQWLHDEISAITTEPAAPETRACTCHPDDNPPNPCARKLAYSECTAPEGRQEGKPRAYIVHAPEDDYYGTGPDRLQFHPLTQRDLDNGYRQTPLYTRPAEQAVTEAQRGAIAYALTKRLVIDMPTARAAVDEALAQKEGGQEAARERAYEWFDANFNGMPDTKHLVDGIIAALAQKEGG